MRLIQGDCLIEMQTLIDEGVQVDCILTDPPYNISQLIIGIELDEEYFKIANDRINDGQVKLV